MITKEKTDELFNIYKSIKDAISSRLMEFKIKWEDGTDEEIFAELAFCILTPQSKAKLCWQTITDLVKNDLLFSNDYEKILDTLSRVRFKYKKSHYLIESKSHFYKNDKLVIKDIISSFTNVFDLREWLVSKIKGYGYKEASHFLRNIGAGENMAILDRHILRNMELYGVIDKIPSSISKNKYFELENALIGFSKEINIPTDHLDILLWFKETKEIFK